MKKEFHNIEDKRYKPIPKILYDLDGNRVKTRKNKTGKKAMHQKKKAKNRKKRKSK